MRDDSDAAAGFAVGLFIGLLLALLTFIITDGIISDRATEAGAAEWTIDPKTGARAWKWTPVVRPVEK